MGIKTVYTFKVQVQSTDPSCGSKHCRARIFELILLQLAHLVGRPASHFTTRRQRFYGHAPATTAAAGPIFETHPRRIHVLIAATVVHRKTV